jgi:hypothetical protein
MVKPNLDTRLANFQKSLDKRGWNHPKTQGLWQRLLPPLYQRMEYLKERHMGPFPNPANEGDFDQKGNVDQFLSGVFRNRTIDVKRKVARRAKLLRQNSSMVAYGCANPVSYTPEEHEHERIVRWVRSIKDDAVRQVAYYLFVDPSSELMSQKDLAQILGKSGSWVSKKIAWLERTHLRLLGIDNHSMELSA